MKNKKSFLTVAVVVASVGFSVFPVSAQQPPNLFAEIISTTGGARIENIDLQTIVPEPIKNFADKAGEFRVDLNDFPKLKSAVESVQGAVGDPADIIRDPGSWWERMNNWLRAKVGFDFRQVAKAMGTFALWALDIVKEVISWVVSKI